MTTKVKKTGHRKDPIIYQEASLILRQGGLVAFPTETVYGLGANGLDAEAVNKIYEAKGRPQDNPLILHIAEVKQLFGLVKSVPLLAETLMKYFWPGPLTLVFQKNDKIPAEASGGLQTIAIRQPAHPVALELVREAGVPVAAPSANIAGRPSPTTANHVLHDLQGRVDMVIDGGQTNVGLESTVVDVTGGVPVLLRPGAVTAEMLEAVIGRVVMDEGDNTHKDFKPKAPGMKYKHYAPQAEVSIVRGQLEAVVEAIRDLSGAADNRVGILATTQTAHCYNSERNVVLVAGDRNHPETIAANLFAMLRLFDDYGVRIVYAESLPEPGLGYAIMNRLIKAADHRVIEV